MLFDDPFEPPPAEHPRWLKRWFVPQYDELALFLMTLACVLLAIFDPAFRAALALPLQQPFDWRSYFLFVCVAAGMLLSVYFAFSSRPKNRFVKFCMLIFALVANGGSGIAAGLHMLVNAKGLLLVFPLWNIITGCLLFVLARYDVIDETCVTDEKTTLAQVGFSSLVLVITFAVCKFWCGLYWAEVLSICVVYACNLNALVQYYMSARRRLTGAGRGW